MSSMHDVRNIKFYRLFIVSWIILFISLFQLGAIAGGTPLTIQNFNYGEWGSYYTVTYADEPYFAGYVSGKISSRDIFTYNATSNTGQLHKVLINEDTIHTLYLGNTLSLKESYVLKVNDFDMSDPKVGKVLLTLSRGSKIDSNVLEAADTYVYSKKVGNISDLPIIAVHLRAIGSNENGVFVTIDGLFEISEEVITITSPSDTPMKIISWSNNQTNDQQLYITVPLNAIRRFKTTHNNIGQIFGHNTNGTLIEALCPDIKNCYQDVRFDKGEGSYYVSNYATSMTLGSDTKTWYVTVLPITNTITSTPTTTPITPTPTTPIPTPTPTPTIISTQTVTPTSTIQIPDIKQRAQLQVTYEVGSLINDRVTIKVFLKNVGDATASNINLTIEHPHELEPIGGSGSEKIGDTISWTGELLPNTEHITEYSIKAIKGKDVEIPLKVTYAKMSREEKAKAFGVSSSAPQASISPEDTETILMIIKILKAIPGFESMLAISILFLVHVVFKIRFKLTPSN